MTRRQQDLIMEFLQLGLHLQALLNQWGGLHILNDIKRRELQSSVAQKEAYTSIMENGYEMETSDGEIDSTNVYVALRAAENI